MFSERELAVVATNVPWCQAPCQRLARSGNGLDLWGEDCAILQVGSLENAQKPMHRMQAPSTERNGLILEYFGYLRRTPASIWGPTGTTFMDSS